MKAGLAVEEMAAKLADTRDRAVDYIAPASSIQFMAEHRESEGEKPETFSVASVTMKTDAGDEKMGVTQYAMGQFASTLGIPKIYWDRLLTEHPDLLTENANTLLERFKGKPRLVRAIGPDLTGAGRECRALLSNSYRPLDNFDLGNVVLPVLQEAECRIASCNVTESRFYVKATCPRLRTEVKVGDIVEGGVFIRNSEVGDGALQVTPFLHRLVCTNGMVTNVADTGIEGLTQYHMGKALGSGGEGGSAQRWYSDDTRKKQDEAFFSSVGDVVRGCLKDEVIAKIGDTLRMGTERHIPDTVEVATVVGRTKDKLGLLEREEKSILDHLARGGDMSQWGLVNAVTRTAEDVQSYDRATELETLGWKLANFGDQQWKSLTANNN